MNKLEHTKRGFEVIKFKDAYNISCSLQQSSSIEPHIWLGVDDVEPKIMAVDAKKLGISTNQTVGWIPYPITKEVLLHNRMHLNRKQVQELVDLLSNWLQNESFEI